jgi:hypothetical protein
MTKTTYSAMTTSPPASKPRRARKIKNRARKISKLKRARKPAKPLPMMPMKISSPYSKTMKNWMKMRSLMMMMTQMI